MMHGRHLLLALAAVAAIAAAQDVRSVWDGVYTEDQAKRGEALYGERCIRCHGPSYMGGTDDRARGLRARAAAGAGRRPRA